MATVQGILAHREEERVKIRSFAARALNALLSLAVIAALAASAGIYAAPQVISVQFINGKNGKVVKKGVRVWVYFYNGSDRQILDLHTDNQGVVQFDAGGAKDFQLSAVGFVACGEQPIGVPARNYSVEEVLDHGLLTKNECGTLHPEPLPGRLQYFVRPATAWEVFKN